jgi:hypothetical protein
MGEKNEQGLQDPHDMNAELNTPISVNDDAFQQKADNYESGDEILKASARDKILERYKTQQRRDLEELGVDMDAYDKLEQEDDLEDETAEQEAVEDEEGKEEEGLPEDKDSNIGKKEKGKAPKEGTDDGVKEEPLSEKPTLSEEAFLKTEIPLKINGVESKATIEELRRSYQLQGHLTQQLQQVAHYKTQLENQMQQVNLRKQEMEAENEALLSQYLTSEEIESRKRNRELRQKEQQLTYQTQFNACKQVLYQTHPDADQLDYDPGFIDFRQKYASMVNENLLTNYGPGVFFPAMDLVMRYYKDVNLLARELRKAQDAGTQLTKERETFLKERDEQQRKAKKQAKEIKPSTVQKKSEDDDDIPTLSHEQYVANLMKKRNSAQGL